MAKLMLHRNILKSFHKLPTKVQKKISEVIEKFQVDPRDPAIGLHDLKESMADPKVRGAKLPGGYRAVIIAPEKGDTYLMVHVDAHDRAYAWAKNKRFEVHESTGLFQVFDAQEVEEHVAEQQEAAAEPEYPLGQLSDGELYAAGVPRPLIASVRAIKSDQALEALGEYLPPDCRDVLVGIAAGMTLDQSLEEMLWQSAEPAAPAAPPESPGDFTHIDGTANFDLVLVEGEEHLKDILQASIEEWRIFLHPYQRKLVRWRTKGPMNITGSAGTGKTVALMHRAAHLAKHRDDPADRILITTFTTNLPVTIKHQLETLAPDAADCIEVTNLHALSRTICRRSGWRGRIADEDDREAIWLEVWLDPALGDLPMPRDEMIREFDLVIDPNGLELEDDYLTTVRSGRKRISRKQRRCAWPVFRAFRRELKKRNLMTEEGAIHQARLAVGQGNFPRYAHVLVDEVQDFSLEAMRLIRAISPIDEGTRDPLCTVGDGHQRIYRAKFPMSRAGIDIRGRSRRLKINYRTSEQIRQYAQGILKGLEIDDLDGGLASVVGDHSVFRGPEPELVRCQDEQAEAEAVLRWVQGLLKEQGLKTHEICVTPYKASIRAMLADAGLTTLELKPREADPGRDEQGVRIGTMQRIKGLEFKAVALACAHASDPMNQIEEAEPRERCERYVAATRAREHLLITIKTKEQ